MKKRINSDQIKKIHTLKSKLKLSEDRYHDMLSAYDVESSKSLSFDDAIHFIASLVSQAEKAGVNNFVVVKPSRNYESFGKSNDHATPAQMRKIAAMWSEKSYCASHDDKMAALDKFLSNRFNIDKLVWLPREMVGKVIKTIESMKGKEN